MIRYISLVLVLITTQANAQTCADHDAITGWLMTEYGEVPHFIGLANEGQVLEIFASPTTGSWTMVLNKPDGETCLVAAGEAFASVTPAMGEAL